MADYTFNIYLWSPYTEFPSTLGSFTFTGDTTATGTAVITDNETGVDGQTLDDNVKNSQETATATVTTPTTTYTDIPINADAGWTLYDPIEDVTFEVVLLNGKDGSVSFAYTLSEYPLVEGRTYDIVAFDNQPNAAVSGDPYFTYADYVCFASKTPIETPDGFVAAGDLREGDIVITREAGPKPILWVGKQTVLGYGKMAPIRFDVGVLGNDGSIHVSPWHRMLVAGAQSQLLFESHEVFVHAKHLTHLSGVTREVCLTVTYVHLLLDEHHALNANGAYAESLHPAKQVDVILSDADKQEIKQKLNAVGRSVETYGPTAYRTLRRFEAGLLTEIYPAKKRYPVMGA